MEVRDPSVVDILTKVARFRRGKNLFQNIRQRRGNWDGGETWRGRNVSPPSQFPVFVWCTKVARVDG